MNDVTLRPFTEGEFDAWHPGAVRDYAEQHVEAGNIAPDTAQEWSAGEFARLLPRGVNSEGHHLLIAERDGQPIGSLWLFIPVVGARRAFVYFVEVNQALRGGGLGRAVMEVGEKYAMERGATSIGLHVFGHNPVARRLYDRMGYQVSSTNMVKSLS